MEKVKYYWNYLIIWVLCFVVSNLGINVERRLPSTGNETLDVILGMVFNVVVVTFTITVVVIVKWVLQTEGSPADTGLIWNMGLDTQRIWGMPLGMTCAIGRSTFLYKKTGNTWLSAILMGTVACLMCLAFGVPVPLPDLFCSIKRCLEQIISQAVLALYRASKVVFGAKDCSIPERSAWWINTIS